MATSKTAPAAKASAKKAAAPSKAPASTKAKPAVKAPVAKAPVKAKAAPVPAAKKTPAKVAPKAATPVKKAVAEVTKTAKDLADFGKQVETFAVPTSPAAKAPAQAVKVTETTEVKVTALPQSTSKLVTGDPRPAKTPTPQPRFDKNAHRNKGGYKGNKNQQQQARHHSSGTPRNPVKSNDPRSNLTQKLLGNNAGAHSTAPVEVPKVDLVPGLGAPAAQFASEALKAIKHATPETIDQISKTLADNVVDNYGTEAGNLATTVVKKMTPAKDDDEGTMLEVTTELMERAKLDSMPPDAAAKRSLRGALNKLMTNQHDVMNSPAKKNANGMLDLTSLFKAR